VGVRTAICFARWPELALYSYIKVDGTKHTVGVWILTGLQVQVGAI
jgi:hypothetical protein